MPKNQCPYCDHDNPAESKFCNACGAALHLAPCPKCGAVNDKSAAQCYRCHHVLSAGGANLLAPPAAVPEIATAVTPASVVAGASARTAPSKPVETLEPYPIEPAARQRPPIFVIAIVLAAFAVASYYAYRQRDAILGHGPAPAADAAQKETRGATASPAGAAASGTIGTAPATPEVPAAAPGAVPEKGTAPAAVTAAPDEPARLSQSPSAPSVPAAVATTTPEVPPSSSRRRVPAPVAEKPPPAPCTEAVAALGLCTLESTQRRQ